MGNPAYDARRAAEQAEAERDKAFAEATKTAMETFMAFLAGKASLSITPNFYGTAAGNSGGWTVRLLPEQKKVNQ